MECTDPFIVDIQWRHVSNFALNEYQIKCHFTPFEREVRDFVIFPYIYWKMSTAPN